MTRYLSSCINADMKSYLEYLEDEAEDRDVELLQAFRIADVPTSTYYRNINGKTELRYSTAVKVLEAIHHEEQRRATAAFTKQLRSDDPDVSRRTARARFKSAKAGT